MGKPRKFCPSCGELVETYVVDRGTLDDGTKKKQDECCILCGMLVLEVPDQEIPPAESIVIANDSAMTRELLSNLLINEKLAKKVSTCNHGADLITLFTRKAVEKEPFSFAILDISMPVLNGINAAISMRAIEKALNIKPIPIIFTVQKCDEDFKKVLAYCKPAQYINKGVSSTPDLLASRISHVVKQLLKENI